MAYLSLYRKWRSQTFDEIVGQEAVVKTLRNAVKLDRLAHAYLFSGPRGTGKTSVARILAKALNCKNGPTPDPCGKCDLCQRIRDGVCVDVIEIDAASNRGINEIRDLRDRVRFTPVEGQYKVYIIDEVHMLTAEAFNALLKTLEEPPEHVVFVLATTDPQRVPVTIWSRCQRLDFRSIPLARIIEQLKKITLAEKIKIEEKALYPIGRAASGSLRDAISLLDQLLSFAAEEIKLEDVVTILGGAEEGVLFNFGEALARGDAKTVLLEVEKNMAEGKSVLQLTKDLIFHFRYLLFARLGMKELIDLGPEQLQQVEAQARLYTEEQLKTILRILSRAQLDMRWQPQARLVLEAALLEVVLEAGDSPRQQVVEERSVPLGETDVLGSVQRDWEKILDKVKSKTLFGYVSLHEGRPLGLNGRGKLMIEYKKGFSFHKQRLEEKNNKAAVEEAIFEITGFQVQIEGVVSEESKPLAEGFSLEKVKEFFGGRVIS